MMENRTVTNQRSQRCDVGLNDAVSPPRGSAEVDYICICVFLKWRLGVL